MQKNKTATAQRDENKVTVSMDTSESSPVFGVAHTVFCAFVLNVYNFFTGIKCSADSQMQTCLSSVRDSVRPSVSKRAQISIYSI